MHVSGEHLQVCFVSLKTFSSFEHFRKHVRKLKKWIKPFCTQAEDMGDLARAMAHHSGVPVWTVVGGTRLQQSGGPGSAMAGAGGMDPYAALADSAGED